MENHYKFGFVLETEPGPPVQEASTLTTTPMMLPYFPVLIALSPKMTCSTHIWVVCTECYGGYVSAMCVTMSP